MFSFSSDCCCKSRLKFFNEYDKNIQLYDEFVQKYI